MQIFFLVTAYLKTHCALSICSPLSLSQILFLYILTALFSLFLISKPFTLSFTPITISHFFLYPFSQPSPSHMSHLFLSPFSLQPALSLSLHSQDSILSHLSHLRSHSIFLSSLSLKTNLNFSSNPKQKSGPKVSAMSYFLNQSPSTFNHQETQYR